MSGLSLVFQVDWEWDLNEWAAVAFCYFWLEIAMMVILIVSEEFLPTRRIMQANREREKVTHTASSPEAKT